MKYNNIDAVVGVYIIFKLKNKSINKQKYK